MKKNQFMEVCQDYDELLAKDGVIIKHRDPNGDGDMNHIRWMINEIPKLVDNPCKIEKANRWLGFVQGVLWNKGYFTIEEMKGHNRSGKECPENDIEIKDTQKYYPFEGGVKDLEDEL